MNISSSVILKTLEIAGYDKLGLILHPCQPLFVDTNIRGEWKINIGLEQISFYTEVAIADRDFMILEGRVNIKDLSGLYVPKYGENFTGQTMESAYPNWETDPFFIEHKFHQSGWEGVPSAWFALLWLWAAHGRDKG